MSSAKTKLKRKLLTVFLLLFLIPALSGCDVDTIPEIIAGKIIKTILERDYDLIYNTGEESAEIPDYTQPSWESPEQASEEAGNSGGGEKEDEEAASEEEEEEEDTEEGEDTDEEVKEDERAYYFSTLNSSDKKIYMEIYNAILSMADSADLSADDPDQVDRIFNLCMMDHPELFFCDGYKATVNTRSGETTGVVFSGKYNVGREDKNSREADIKAAADKILSGVPDDDSEYEKVKYIYEWIIDNTEYVDGAPDNQNISSVFLNHKSVCQGYTMATKYLLDRMGIFCTVVYGTAANENHAWNLARLDGTYCYIDTTFGDSSYRDKDNIEASITSYNYFGCDSEILLRTHQISEWGKLPECTSLDSYYYVRESKYFTKVDKERLKAVFDHETAENSQGFTIRASSEEVYHELFETLFTEREIFNLVPEADKVTYIEDETELTLTFRF